MKKYLVAMTSIILSSSIAAQSLSVEVEDYYYADAGTECVAQIDVKNLTNQDLNVIVTRSSSEMMPTNYMCWLVCHLPNIDVSTPLLVPANSLVDNFSGHIVAIPEESDLRINYCFAIEDNPSDRVCVDVDYTSSSVYMNVEDIQTRPSTFVFPNPVKEILNVDVASANPSEFILFDVLGNRVYNEVLTGSSTINVSSFEAGIYFYTLSVKGRETEVQKLIISN